MKKSRPYPIESFGPELLNALVRGSTQRIVIELPSYRAGIRLRFRLQQLRQQMRNADHTLASTVARAKTTLEWGERAGHPRVPEVRNAKGVARPLSQDVRCRLVIEPHDTEFTNAIVAAGVSPATLVLDHGPPVAPTREEESSDDFLTRVLGPGSIKKNTPTR